MREAENLRIKLCAGDYKELSEKCCRQLGAFFGNLIGDALGAPFEFNDFTDSVMLPNSEYLFPETVQQYEATYNTHQIVNCAKSTSSHFNKRFGGLAGQWTDDSCQMLILAEVLIAHKKVNGVQLHWGIEDWWKRGFCLAYSKPLFYLQQNLRDPPGAFGLGQTSSGALDWFQEQNLGRDCTQEVCRTESGSTRSDGNGALMRNGATFLIKSLKDAVMAAIEQALTTHKGIDSSMCCAIHTYVGWCFINKQNLLEDGFVNFEQLKKDFDGWKIELSSKMLDIVYSTGDYNWRSEEYDYPDDVKRGSHGCAGGYAVDCLAMCLHYALRHSALDLEELATRGGDSDSNAAVLGALLGAKWGITAFRNNWVRAVLRFDEYNLCVARALALIHGSE